MGVLQQNPTKRNLKIVEKHRSKVDIFDAEPFIIQELPIVELQNQPIMIESNWKLPGKTIDKEYMENGTHIFVLMHGLDASHCDMIRLLNHITLVNKHCGFIIPRSAIRK